MGSNSIYCALGKHWIHKRCSGIRGRLTEAENHTCSNCINSPQEAPSVSITVDGDQLETVPTFCYLDDTIGDNGGNAVTVRLKSAWIKFRELLPILTNKSISSKSRGSVFSAGIRGVFLHASETWTLTDVDKMRLTRNDNAMVRWICSLRLSDLRTDSIPSLDVILRQGRLRWFGHIKRMDDEQ